MKDEAEIKRRLEAFEKYLSMLSGSAREDYIRGYANALKWILNNEKERSNGTKMCPRCGAPLEFDLNEHLTEEYKCPVCNIKIRRYIRSMHGGGMADHIELWFKNDSYIYADIFSGEYRAGGDPDAHYVIFGYEYTYSIGGKSSGKNFIPEKLKEYLPDLIREILRRHSDKKLILEVKIF